MTQGQKIIKVFAIALAIFLIMNIISAIFWILSFFGGAFGLYKEEGFKENMETISTSGDTIQELKVELNSTNLEIKIGDTFKVETNNSKITYKNEKGRVVLKEEGSFWSGIGEKTSLLLYLPNDVLLQDVEIESGAGSLNIENLTAETFDLEQGAGKIVLENVRVSRQTKIDGGAGKMEILSSSFHRLDLDLGMGEFVFEGQLTGNNEMDSGIGNVDMTLTDGLENYTIKAQKGIGSMEIRGQEQSGEITYGDGITKLKVDGGIGKITIN